MAYERLSSKKILATNLDSYIGSQLNLIEKMRTQKNLEEESRFTKAVLEDNLTLDQQLSFRQDQLKNIEVGDKTERRRIRDDISNIKNMIEQKEFSDTYLDELTKVNSGVQSIDNTIKWLQDKLAKTTDQGIYQKIREQVNELKGKLYEQRTKALSSQTEFAINNKAVDILEKQIIKVNDARSKAILAGNDDYVALLDLQVQALNKSLNEEKISKSIMDVSVKTMTGQSSLSMLNEMNRQIQNSDATSPITIGGIKYESAKQFWEMKRGEYLSDRTSNGFFGRYSDELKEQVEYRSTRGILNNNNFYDAQEWFDGLAQRPELAEYKTQIDYNKQRGLKIIADLRTDKIVGQYSVDFNIKKALNELSYIQDKFGIDQALNYQKIVLHASGERQRQVQEILDTTAGILKDNPEMTNEEAINQAISSGAGNVVTPKEAVEKTPGEIVKEQAGAAAAEGFAPGTEGKIAPETSKKFETPSLTEGALYKQPGTETVYRYEGGQLRPTQGQLPPEEVNSVEEIKDISTIKIGEPIQSIAAQPKEEPTSYIKAVFGQTWQPSKAFTSEMQQQKGIYGAVRQKGGIDVFVLQQGGPKKVTAEEYKTIFGTSNQQGIVGEVNEDQAKKLKLV